ncbi:hypothetical protein [Azospirillum sp. SYSU D00513]|uniref:hypothetical protein n=1 Tax=Azospirillum sp. SYSU D00513 TaxID=2812561 RepID=UPI001A970BB3|nr:hypothetical protein [Azospirillum sp. SYSU D00513]
MGKTRTVTVVADASFDERSKLAGFAVWVTEEAVSRQISGHVSVKDSCEAELAALGNGIVYAIRTLHLAPGDVIIVRSDNQHASGLLCGWTKPREDRPGDLALAGWVRKVVRKRGIILRSWHLEGHQGDRTVDAAIQGWCDSTARAALSMARVEGLRSQAAA